LVGRIFRAVRTPFTLLVLLGILCYGAWWGYRNVIREVPPAPPTPCVKQKVAKGQLRSTQVVVNVFNGGDKRGLAGDVSRALRERGFRIQRVADTGENIQRTVIVGAGAKNPEVLLVRGFFKGAEVRADPKNKTDGSVDVLVGNRYGGFNRNAARTFKVASSTVCLPPAPSPSATLGS
jgi:hypothetical protein